MTLHKTVEYARKALLGILLGFGAIIILVIFFRLILFVKDIVFPPKPQLANTTFGHLPALKFPQNATKTPLTYTINTVSGQLPQFSDRLNIYPIKQPQPNLLNLNKVKAKVLEIGFKDEKSKVLPENALGNSMYEWRETTGLRRRIVFDTVTFNFKLTSNYLSSLTVLEAKELSDEQHAITTALSFLNTLSQAPLDIDKNKTSIELLSLTNGELIPTTSLSKSQVIRIDLQQKDVTYELNTGIPLSTGGFKKTPLTLPILYPNPPYSTMSFWIASGLGEPQVVAADYIYQPTELPKDLEATYPIKSVQTAFEELKNGKAYIASFHGSQKEIAINKIYLAYYLGASPQEYLMPIIVFEGEGGFFAYVSAVRDEWIK